MRMIDRSTAFKRDYKRNKHNKNLDSLLSNILKALTADKPLPVNNRDHSLSGNWQGYRECHVKPDLLLIYKKIDENILWLARLGSHSELFD